MKLEITSNAEIIETAHGFNYIKGMLAITDRDVKITGNDAVRGHKRRGGVVMLINSHGMVAHLNLDVPGSVIGLSAEERALNEPPSLMGLFGLFKDNPIDIGAGWDEEEDSADNI